MLGRGTFALVNRSLRVDTRLARTHLVRLIFAGVILALLINVQRNILRYSTPGLDVFEQICWLNFFLLNLAGMSFFSTVITEEKEEMTLGLLRMAGIRGIGILLGKVSPRLLGAMLLLSVQVPFTFLAITLGGVTTHQILAAYITLLSFAVFLSGLGALFSTVCSRSNLAASLTTGALAAIYIGPGLIQKAAVALTKRGWMSGNIEFQIEAACEWVTAATPLHALRMILGTNYRGDLLSHAAATNVTAGVVMFFVAWALFDSYTRNERTVAPARGMMALLSTRISGANRVWNNALAWKDFNFLTGGMMAVIIKFLAYGILMGAMSVLIARSLRTEFIDNIGSTLILSMLTALAVEMPIYLSRVFREELRWKTWPGLVMLPVSVGELLRNKLLGVLPTFLPAFLVMLVGAFLAPSFLADISEAAFLTSRGWYIMTQYILMIHVVLLFSLVIKWGALPMGLAVVIVPNIANYQNILFAPNLRGWDAALIYFPMFLAIALSVVINFVILAQLRRLSAL